jgi:hypothetical protein
MSHNIIQIHDLTLLYGIFFIFSLNVEIFHEILSVPRNIVMDLNNVTVPRGELDIFEKSNTKGFFPNKSMREIEMRWCILRPP